MTNQQLPYYTHPVVPCTTLFLHAKRIILFKPKMGDRDNER